MGEKALSNGPFTTDLWDRLGAVRFEDLPDSCWTSDGINVLASEANQLWLVVTVETRHTARYARDDLIGCTLFLADDGFSYDFDGAIAVFPSHQSARRMVDHIRDTFGDNVTYCAVNMGDWLRAAGVHDDEAVKSLCIHRSSTRFFMWKNAVARRALRDRAKGKVEVTSELVTA